MNINDALIRIFGSVQAQTQSALLFDANLRKELFALNAEFRWVCEVYYSCGLDTDAVLLTPASVCNAVLNNGGQLTIAGGSSLIGKSSSTADEGGGLSSGSENTLIHVGTLRSEWSDADGTEDPVKWVQRTSINPGGSLQTPPFSIPIVFASEFPAIRIANAAAKGVDFATRASRTRQRLADEAGIDVSELDGAELAFSSNGVSPTAATANARMPGSRGGGGGGLGGGVEQTVEPALRCPLQLKTFVQMRIPRGPLFGNPAGAASGRNGRVGMGNSGARKPFTSPSASSNPAGSRTLSPSQLQRPGSSSSPYAADSLEDFTEASDPFAYSSPIASLPSTTSYVSCTTDLAIRPLTVKTQLTRGDVLNALQDIKAQDKIYQDAAKKAEAEASGRAGNPYAVDEGPLEGEEGGGFGFATTRNAAGEKNASTNPSAGVGAFERTAVEDGDAICGYANIRVSFADLSLAIAPIVAIKPDATTVTSSTALIPAASHADRDAITQEALQKDLLKCSFVEIKSIVPAKVLEWSMAPRTITYGCMPLVDLYRHLVFFYTIATIHFATKEALNGNAKKAPVRAYEPLLKQLVNHRPSCYRDPISGAFRWDTLTSLSLFHYILGDNNILPVLSLISCCRGLEFADFNTNALTTISMRRIVEVLRRHPSIRTVDLSGNTFFESAGDEILRLLKTNRNIVGCAIANNHFTDRLADRILRHAAQNSEHLKEDPLNFLSSNYNYLRSVTDVPPEVWMTVHQLWVTIIAAPLDTHPKNIESADAQTKRQKERERASILSAPAAPVIAAPKQLLVPMAAEVPAVVAAPLFAESMRHVQIEVLSKLTQDRIIRGLFRDFAAHQGDHLMEEDLPTLQAIEKKGIAPDSALGMPRYSRSYAKMLVTALNATLNNAGRSYSDRQLAWRDTVRVLQGLGECQYELGCRPWHLMFANRAFLQWMSAVLGPSLMDPLAMAAWGQVLALISRAVVSGTPLPTA